MPAGVLDVCYRVTLRVVFVLLNGAFKAARFVGLKGSKFRLYCAFGDPAGGDTF